MNFNLLNTLIIGLVPIYAFLIYGNKHHAIKKNVETI
jgi:hypothetical protein